MKYKLTVVETNNKSARYRYTVLDENGVIICSRDSNRSYVACTINGGYYFGRLDLIGKGGHGANIKWRMRYGKEIIPIAYLDEPKPESDHPVKQFVAIPILSVDQCRSIETLVLQDWEKRALKQGYKKGSKKIKELQTEFLLGMVATLDVLTNAEKTSASSISPKVMFGIMRGDYIE